MQSYSSNNTIELTICKSCQLIHFSLAEVTMYKSEEKSIHYLLTVK